MSTTTRRIPSTVYLSIFIFCAAIPQSYAASAQEIDIKVNAALERFKTEIDGAEAFLQAAEAVLIFPTVLKAGLVVGGEYGEGALRIGGKTVQYYSAASASIGFQMGAQSKTEVILFMQKDALNKFQKSEGWEAGVDGSVALIKIGAGETINTTSIKDPIIGFIFSNKGLMYNLTLEGSKFTRITR